MKGEKMVTWTRGNCLVNIPYMEYLDTHLPLFAIKINHSCKYIYKCLLDPMGINVGASMICEHESFVGQHLKNPSRIQISWEIFLKLILDFHNMFFLENHGSIVLKKNNQIRKCNISPFFVVASTSGRADWTWSKRCQTGSDVSELVAAFEKARGKHGMWAQRKTSYK